MFKEVWLERKIITGPTLDVLQACVDNTLSPPELGRIPRKIASNFGGFTGEQ